MSSEPNIRQPPSAGGGEAPAVLPEANLRFDGGGRGLPAPQAARAFASPVFNFFVWLGVRMVIVMALLVLVFLGIEIVADLSEQGVFESEGGQLLACALGLVSAGVVIWFFVAVCRFFISAASGFRAGMKEPRDD